MTTAPYIPEGFTLENPGFDDARKTHDWRTALAMDAQDRAGADEWN